MNILIVGNINPSPVKMGNQKFLVSHIELLKNMGHTVDYLYYNDGVRQNTIPGSFKGKDLDDIKVYSYKPNLLIRVKNGILRKINLKLRKGSCNADDYYPQGISSYIKKLNRINNYDACFINYFYLSKTLPKIKIPIKGFYTHDSFINRNIINQSISPSLSPNQEAKALKRAEIIFALQDTEANLFKRLAPQSTVKTIYMPLSFVESKIVNNHNVLFFAGRAFFNLEGIKKFISEIWPSIINEYADAKLIIGGGICDNLRDTALPDSVDLQGYIEDVPSFYQQGDISINPVFHGSGLKIKTMEGIEYNKVVLSTSHSVQGMYQVDRAPIIIADTKEEWISAFKGIWDHTDNMVIIKDRGKPYVLSLSEAIKNEYKSILNPLS